MEIEDILKLYEAMPQVKALRKVLEDKSTKHVFLKGLMASATPLVFASMKAHGLFLFVLPDADEAGYFYHDLTQLLGTERVWFFPSSYRRAVKYGQRDGANEILRTEVLARLTKKQLDLLPKIKSIHYEARINDNSLKEAYNNGLSNVRITENQGITLKIGVTAHIDAIFDLNVEDNKK